MSKANSKVAGRGKTKLTPEGLRAIGEVLKGARDAKGWSLVDLESAVGKYEASLYGDRSEGEQSDYGVSASTINRYENGFVKRPSLPTLNILLKVLEPINPHTNKPYTLEEVVAVGMGCNQAEGKSEKAQG